MTPAPAPARPLVRKVRFTVAEPHLSHEPAAHGTPAAADAPAVGVSVMSVPTVGVSVMSVPAVDVSAMPAPAVAAALRALAHGVLPAGAMVWATLAGHEPAAMVAAALALALLSFAYAPLARTRAWAREHLADLWAMLLLMAVMALSRAESTFPLAGKVDMPRVGAYLHDMSAGFGMLGAGGMLGTGESAAGAAGGAAGATSAAASAAAVAVVVAWALARALLARRGWRIHSLVSFAVCGAGLAWMLLA
jgi:hypothetical protein